MKCLLGTIKGITEPRKIEVLVAFSSKNMNIVKCNRCNFTFVMHTKSGAIPTPLLLGSMIKNYRKKTLNKTIFVSLLLVPGGDVLRLLLLVAAVAVLADGVHALLAHQASRVLGRVAEKTYIFRPELFLNLEKK